MYLFGGYRNKFLNDMFILDTINLNWEKRSFVNAPPPRISYDAILISNQHIIYLGK